ncbi:hypothetical protein TSUD_283320 [Trifolium subterraneum]|uniref:Uncharacterized protein n=1 Tax=Trifolium subterraneum TaxID=3900 RepID=A0A2Z6PLT5_TRISU|nr:hypothetical protein TSUD_283320 [Trifolium subterraneum]
MPNVEIVQLTRSNLSLCLPMVIMWFAKMTMLDLTGSDFRVLPECLKECTSLLVLELDDCHSLEDICAIPPNLQRLSALNCKSLNSSSKSMLMNKKLHESGETEFRFSSAEGEMIPEWFKHQSRETTESGTTFPFWFRNKLPLVMIFLSIKSKMKYEPHFATSEKSKIVGRGRTATPYVFTVSEKAKIVRHVIQGCSNGQDMLLHVSVILINRHHVLVCHHV